MMRLGHNDWMLPKGIANLAAWYDACRVGAALESGAKVSTWNDLSGNGLHLLQATDSKRPVWTDSTQHGRPAVVFTGSSEHVLVTSGNWTGGAVATLVMVGLGTNTGASAYMWGCNSSTAVRKGTIMIGADGVISAGHNTGVGVTYRASSGSYLDTPVVVIATHNISSSTDEVPTLRVNGASGSSLSNNNNTANLGGYPLYAGSGRSSSGATYLTGWLAEMMLYGRILGAGEIAAVELYLSKKWGIKLA